MRKVLLVGICLLISIKPILSNGVPIIPKPVYAQKLFGKFHLTNKTYIVYDDEISELAIYLQQELLKYNGLSLVTFSIENKDLPDNETSNIVLKYISNKKKNKNAEEAYSLKITDENVIISAYSKRGVFYGITSLIQLVRLSETKKGVTLLDCWNIKDYPLYSWRGLMLDEARHFFGKEKVKQLLDWMSLYRFNKFHWHLTDAQGWRIEIKQYPKLAYVGGIGCYSNPYAPSMFYTQEDIKEIVRYASQRFIDVIPEIDMPGHASAANRAYPEYSGGGTMRRPDFTFNPGKEETYQYLTNIISEVDILFPSQIIHLGGDEVHYGNRKWKSDENVVELMKKKNLVDLKEVERYFFMRMSDSLFARNNKMAAWDEVADSNLDVDKTIVFFWRHDKPEQLQKSLDKGFSVVLCPRLPMYFDYAQDTLQIYGVPWERRAPNSYDMVYNFTKDDLNVKYSSDDKILGIQANLWTEQVQTKQRLDYMLFPRIAALAETAWTKERNKNLEDFNNRLVKHISLYKKDKIYYYDPFNPKNTGEPMNF